MLGSKFKIVIHPLFLLVGALSAVIGTGGFFIFLSATLAALEHEFAHALVARRYGYEMNKIVLMPYGAVIGGDISDMGTSEKLCVLAAGPLCNAFTALFFVALWWLFPETYPYTDVAFYVSLSLFFVNLLPAYPLDGGRALKLLIEKRSKKAARITGLVCNFTVVALVLAYFIVTCVRGEPAYTAPVFAALLFAGAFRGGGSYRTVSLPREKSLMRGLEEKRIVISCDCPLKRALRYLSENRYLVFVLYDGGEYYGEMSEGEYLSALDKNGYSVTFREAYG